VNCRKSEIVRPKGRLARLGAALVATVIGLALAYVLVVYVGGALLSGVTRVIVLIPRAFVWLVLALQEGADGWTIAARIASSVAGIVTTTQIAFALVALELIGAAALYGLQRLLRAEQGAAGAEDDSAASPRPIEGGHS
jgi:hypothetical protein